MRVLENLTRELKVMTRREPGRYAAGDKRILCPHCRHDEFARHRMLGGPLIVSLVCARCSMVIWFESEPEPLT